MAKLRSCLTFEVEHTINFLALENQSPVFYLGSGTNNTAEYLAVGTISQIETNTNHAFEQLKLFRKKNSRLEFWLVKL